MSKQHCHAVAEPELQLSSQQLQALGLALLDFSGAEDLTAWLAEHGGRARPETLQA